MPVPNPAPGGGQRRYLIRRVLIQLDRLILRAYRDPDALRKPIVYFDLLDAADNLDRAPGLDRRLYRQTRLAVKEARERLLRDTADHYSWMSLATIYLKLTRAL